MNTAVYKYPLHEKVKLPKEAEILKVAWHKTPVQEAAFIWALVDLDATEEEERTFQLIVTGGVVKDNNLLVKPTYLDSLFCYGGSYVLHVFENIKL